MCQGCSRVDRKIGNLDPFPMPEGTEAGGDEGEHSNKEAVLRRMAQSIAVLTGPKKIIGH